MIFDLSREILNVRLGRVPTKVFHIPPPPLPGLIVPFQDRNEKSKRSREIVSAVEVENVSATPCTLPKTHSYQSSAEPSAVQETEQAIEGIQLRESGSIQTRPGKP